MSGQKVAPDKAGTTGPTLLSSAQVMERLGLTYRQLDRMRSLRRIGYYKRGGRVLYADAEVERVLRESEVPALKPVVNVRGSEKG